MGARWLLSAQTLDHFGLGETSRPLTSTAPCFLLNTCAPSTSLFMTSTACAEVSRASPIHHHYHRVVVLQIRSCFPSISRSGTDDVGQYRALVSLISRTSLPELIEALACREPPATSDSSAFIPFGKIFSILYSSYSHDAHRYWVATERLQVVPYHNRLYAIPKSRLKHQSS